MRKGKKVNPEIEYLLSVSEKNQKYIYTQLVIEPLDKVIKEYTPSRPNLTVEEKFKQLNNLLAKHVGMAWRKLNKKNRILIPLETVMPVLIPNDDLFRWYTLKLSSNLVCLLNGKLDPRLTPLIIDA